MDFLEDNPGCAKLGFSIVGLIILIGITWAIIGTTFLKRTDPGNVGIVITYGTNGRPNVTVVPTNTYTWINPFAGQSFIEYPTAQQNLIMSDNSSEGQITGKDAVECQASGIPMRLGVTVLWSVDSQRADVLYLREPNVPLTGTFNSDISSTIVRQIVKNDTIAACTPYTAEDILKDKRAALVADMKTTITNDLEPQGIHVNQVFVTEVNPPQWLSDALKQKEVANQQAQQAQYLKTKAQYEAEAAVAKSQGDAKSIQIINEQLSKSPAYIQYLIAQKWNGQLPSTLSTTGNPIFAPFPK